jgi:ribosomal silencing factor RsfS
MAPLHYVVIAGLDPERQLVLLNDPAQRKLLQEDRSRFEQEWKGAGRWTLLALPEASSR